MPPITDPALLAQIQQQQQGPQNGPLPPAPPQTLAGPPMPPPSIIPNGQLIQPTNLAAVQHTGTTDNIEKASGPAVISEHQSNAEIAKLRLRQLRIAQGLDPDTGKPSVAEGAMGTSALDGLKPEDQTAVKSILTGRTPLTPYMLTRSPEYQRLWQIAQQVEPGADLGRLAQRGAAFKSFMTGPDGRTVDRVNQALAHFDRFMNSAKGLDNIHNESGLNPLALGNYGRAALMAANKSPKYQAFAADRDAVATELAAAFKGGNDPALASVEHWQHVLSAANSPEAFDAQAKEIAGLLGGRLDAMTYRFQQATGPYSDAYSLLTPDATAIYKKYSDPNYAAEPEKDPVAISTKEKAIDLPPGYQEASEKFLSSHQPGTLTVPEYIAARKQMDQEFGGGKIESQLDPKAVQEFVDAFNKGVVNPKSPVPVGTVPLSGFDKARAEFSAGPVGNFLENAANAGTLGAVDLAAGQGAREAERVNDSNHPIASTLGDVAGSIVPITGLESGGMSLLKKVAPEFAGTARGKLLASVIGNSAYGGFRGFAGADDGHGAEGMLEGIAGGGLGAVGGNAVGKGVKAFMAQPTLDALQRLKGVDLTTLQRLGFGKGENAFRNLPFVRGASADAMDSMNADRANQALSYIGEKLPSNIKTATDRNNFVYDTANKAYEDIKPHIVGSVDKPFQNSIIALKGMAGTAEKKGMYRDINDAINLAFDKNGHFEGNNFKAALERLRVVQQSLLDKGENEGSLAARDMAAVAGKAQTQLKALVRRQVPEAVADRLDNVDRVWASKMQLEDATNRTLATNDGVYSPSQAITTMKKFDTSVNKNLSARGKMPGQQYLMDAQNLMGSNPIPASVGPRGAFESVVGLGGAGGAGAAVSPAIPIGLAGLGTAAYAPGVKRVTQAILTGTRPKAVQKLTNPIADAIRHRMTGN